MKATEEGLSTSELNGLIEQLKASTQHGSEDKTKQIIQKIVSNYTEAKH